MHFDLCGPEKENDTEDIFLKSRRTSHKRRVAEQIGRGIATTKDKVLVAQVCVVTATKTGQEMAKKERQFALKRNGAFGINGGGWALRLSTT
jgi:hypothetical protein